MLVVFPREVRIENSSAIMWSLPISMFVRFAVEGLKIVLIFLCGGGADSLQSNDDSYSCAIVPRCKIIGKTGKPRILHQNLSYNDMEINLLMS